MRYAEGLFLAEGFKMCHEALHSQYQVEAVVVRAGTMIPKDLDVPEDLCHETSEADFKRIATQSSPEGIITVLRIPGAPWVNRGQPREMESHGSNSRQQLPPGPAFILAAIQDPGNLGTILRTSDWFGFPSLILGPGTVDPFNPKVTRSSMGSLFRTQLYILDDLEGWLQSNADQVWCADMEGEALGQVDLTARPYILLGNESLGVPPEIAAVKGIRKVNIPRSGSAESLNAATAGAIFAWEMNRCRLPLD